MNTPNKLLQKQVLSQIWAFILLGLFVNALIIQGFHHHHSSDQVAANLSVNEKSQESAQVQSAKINCKLCEVLKQQSHFYILPTPALSLAILSELKKSTFNYVPQHSVAFILAAANKGPPSLLA